MTGLGFAGERLTAGMLWDEAVWCQAFQGDSWWAVRPAVQAAVRAGGPGPPPGAAQAAVAVVAVRQVRCRRQHGGQLRGGRGAGQRV